MKKILPFLAALCLAPVSLRAADFPPVTIGGMEFCNLEVARTDKERETGLMDRYWLAEDGGMLFVFDEPRPAAMWMKNTRIPLDCLFLDATGKVLKVVTMAVEPKRRPDETVRDYEKRLPSYTCTGRVACVVELRAGLAFDLGIRAGDRIDALSLHRILKGLPRE